MRDYDILLQKNYKAKSCADQFFKQIRELKCTAVFAGNSL